MSTRRTMRLTILTAILGLSFLACPGILFSFDQPWDSGHNYQIYPPSPPTGPPGPSTGGDGSSEPPPPDVKPPPPPEPPPPKKDPPTCNACDQKCKADAKKSPVFVQSGNLELSFYDFHIAGPGLPLLLLRTYNSFDLFNGPFGFGWVSNLFVKLIKVSDSTGDYVIIRRETGKRVRYKKNTDGSYSPDSASVTDRLIENSNGTFTLNCGTCASDTRKPVYQFNPVGNMTSMSDTDGNSLNFTYDVNNRLSGVTSSASGKSLAFTFGANEKVSNITDSFGRSWKYEYDAAENLVKVIDPLGYFILYAYDSNHKLLSVTDKNGNLSLVLTYDAQGRVITYGSPGEIYTYAYFTGYTTKTDSLGNLFKFYYDANGNVTKTVLPDGTEILTEIDENINVKAKTDPSGETWTYTYNEQGQVLTETDPLGNTTAYTYDIRFGKIQTKTNARGFTWSNTYNAQGNLIRTTDPLGCETTYTHNGSGQVLTETSLLGTWTYQYDTQGNRTKVTFPSGFFETYTYDAMGNMITKTDARGNTWTNTYDLLGRMANIQDPYGKNRSYTYDGNGNLSTETDENGHTTSYQYDANNRKISVTDALGNKTLHTYDAVGNLISTKDPRGGTTTWAYNNRYLATSETNALGEAISFTYDVNGNRRTKVDARGNTWSDTYDVLGRLLTESNPLGNTFSYVYDAVGNKTKVTNPAGKVIYYEYDALNRLKKMILKMGDTSPTPDADDIVTTYAYDCAGRRISETNALGQTTTWTYDFRGNSLTETNPLGEVKSFTYDPNGNNLTHTTVGGNVISYTYDKLNRVISVSDSVGLIETYEYDGVGNRTKKTTSDGNVFTATYTAFNKPATATDPMGNATTYAYDANYNLITVVDRLGHTTTQAYDALNRLYQVTDPLGNVTTLSFDRMGNLLKTKDAKNNETTYVYDKANRKVSITSPNGKTRSVVYDGAGKVIQKTDENGNIITYAWDDAYRLTRRNYPDLSRLDYTYDKLGRLLTATNAYGTISITYDAAGRPTSMNQNGKVVAYSYDTAGRKRTITYPNGKIFVEEYTKRDKLENILNDTDDVTVMTHAYDSQGRPMTMTLGNGLTAHYSYNKNGWLTGLSHKNGSGAEFLGFQYDYDPEGNRLYTKESPVSTASEQYLYDAAQRLTIFKRGTLDGSNQIPSPVRQIGYTLDQMSNWTQVNLNSSVENRSANNMNQYTMVAGTPHSYDSNGNLTDDGTYLYTYDYENLLTKITRKSDSAVIAQYVIDALSRRVKKITGGTTTEYVYDNSRVIEEWVGGVSRAYYVYGNKLDEAILMDRDGMQYFFHADVLGSTVALTNALGVVAESYEYDPYGAVTFFNASGQQIASSSADNHILFTGRDYDSESGLYYYRARYLSPRLGRFLNPDPKEFEDSMNLYEYALSNPIRFIDPRGTISIDWGTVSIETCDTVQRTISGDLIASYLPAKLQKMVGNANLSLLDRTCEKCCAPDSKHPGAKMKDREIRVQISWSGGTGWMTVPGWGAAWDVDYWFMKSKGFIGISARAQWGLAGSLGGSTDNCKDTYKGKGCVRGSVSFEVVAGVSIEEELQKEPHNEKGWIQLYLSGGVTGEVAFCLVAGPGVFRFEVEGTVRGSVKLVWGIWKYRREENLLPELAVKFGPIRFKE